MHRVLRFRAAVVATAVLASVPSAQTSFGSPSSLSAQASFEAFLLPSANTTDLVAMVEGLHGKSFVLFATPTGSYQPSVVGTAPIRPDGSGELRLSVPNQALASLPMGLCFDFTAAYVDAVSGAVVHTPWETLMLGTQPCEFLGFNNALGTPLVAGEEISEQFAGLGLHVSADNKTPGHPDKVIVFDSSNPTGEDEDLMTPGPGANNNLPLNNLMIVAEDCVDLDGDGLVDDPDDEEGGGVIEFAFDEPVSFCSIRLVDLDDGGGSEIRFYLDGLLVDVLPLAPGGPNSVTIIAGLVQLFDRMEIDFQGSGAIANFAFVFCPTEVGFDQFTSGAATGLEPGEELTDQLSDVGMSVSAINAFPGHPDKAILFDSADPTGEDDDLLTPGPGIGNGVPRGLVLILAEDDVDLDGDGLVDDPDDEEQGGVIRMDFALDVLFTSATVLDVDADEASFFLLLDAGGSLLAQIPLQRLGDNSSQTVSQEVEGVRRIELHLGGSGALADLQYCPEVGGG